MVDDSFFELIVQETNRYAVDVFQSENVGEHSRITRWCDTTVPEMRLFWAVSTYGDNTTKSNARLLEERQVFQYPFVFDTDEQRSVYDYNAMFTFCRESKTRRPEARRQAFQD